MTWAREGGEEVVPAYAKSKSPLLAQKDAREKGKRKKAAASTGMTDQEACPPPLNGKSFTPGATQEHKGNFGDQ